MLRVATLYASPRDLPKIGTANKPSSRRTMTVTSDPICKAMEVTRDIDRGRMSTSSQQTRLILPKGVQLMLFLATLCLQ